MNDPASVLQTSIFVMCLAPVLLLGALSISSLFGKPLQERTVGILTRIALLVAFTASITALTDYLAIGSGPRVFSYGSWFSYEGGGFAFDFVADGMSLGFATLAIGVCGVVAAFSFRYLHLEPGFHRYFVQLAMFLLGITLVALAGSIEVLFAGWELLGLSSALLVGFFHERPAPVNNALRVFAVYRASDAAMLGAAVLLHHWAGSGSLPLLFSKGSGAELALSPGQLLAITVLITVAVAGKSALLPFSGWLPRAMEGPTPSSAVYYGALSIHAGCFLLLRAEPLLAQSVVAQVLAAMAGATTALYATFTARVQTDVKSALAYASLTQVGIIVVEISLGFTTVAFVHITGHACFRLLQFLGAPNILHDLHELEKHVGGHIAPALGDGTTHRGSRPALYLAALERGFADPLLDRLIVKPFRWVVGHLDRLDRLLSGSRETGGHRRI
jgi:NAD(P)H-quinone oxidoreductase subunit 5